ncbi:Cytosolic Fe-S cluster assembly factor NAR1 [Madurella mycetomatis]|uniref:Nuclear architecture-related protein 1 n=1 Tax=Madurella mycetomatis TaxID=100816 RepID=A0A175WAM8_9PEZI|nr:Cytosolic Fe-S cluster assembly factor NAR1 [Madurella mycetomatis]KXX80539.1 Cytosolic Fe-S cluster assembly factor NAR1 [Madurella mycetomatis]
MSAILSADDLNDFISPGVACIKPVETLPAAAPPSSEPESLEFEVILDGQQPSASSSGVNPPAQISLTDCLACSGCVTSAEAVLVSLQSHAEVLSVLDAAAALRLTHHDDGNGRSTYKVLGLEDPASKLFVASVSPQTRASLAAACGGGVTEQQAGYMIEQLLRGEKGLASGGKHGNGFTWVVDTNTARDACLVLGSDEVLGGEGRVQGSQDNKPVPPILTSSCPGWVCYAEKTHPYVLPHLSRVKSPQALMGTLLKTTLSRLLGISPDRIWHLAIMPCFDKKLEASREELTDAIWTAGTPGKGVRDVDCVITSKEILMLADSRGIDFFGLPTSAPQQQQPAFPDPIVQRFLFPAQRCKQHRDAGTSGGNLHFILHDAQSRHAGSSIQMTRGRNADVVEYAVIDPSGEAVFKAARYYGFRNIQNLVRKLKPAKPSRMPGGKPFGSARKPTGKSAGLDHAYVEVMACPGGCTNGGGQIKVDDQVIVDRKAFGEKPGPQEQKAWLAEVDEAYFSADESGLGNAQVGDGRPVELIAGISPSHIRDTLAHWADITGIQLDRLVYTSYREVVSDVGKSQITDTERVVQLAGKIGGGW